MSARPTPTSSAGVAAEAGAAQTSAPMSTSIVASLRRTGRDSAATAGAVRQVVSPAVLLAIYSLALLISAALLFVLEPLVGKLALPLLGSTPEVWNATVMFFQAALLAGYAY